jgi:hypothetical protein
MRVFTSEVWWKMWKGKTKFEKVFVSLIRKIFNDFINLKKLVIRTLRVCT